MSEVRKIWCETCEAPGEADFSGATPVVPEDWEALLSIHGWEYQCPACWGAFLAHIENERRVRAA